jgi:hypothetical protein
VRSGFAKIAASSAYKEQRREAALGRTGCNSPLLAASSISRCSGSIAKMKSMGDSGSPCRSPLACLIRFPGTPFTSILDDDVARRVAIQSLYFCPKPKAGKVSRRKIQLTKSKALDMSSLIKREGRLALCRALITFWTCIRNYHGHICS